MQISTQLACYELHLFHLLRRLCDELARGETASLQAIVRLDILDIWILDLAPEEVEIFHLWVVLYDNWWLKV